MPSRIRKKPSAVRSPVTKSRSYSSTSLVRSAARERIRARDEHRRHAADVGGESRGVERADELLGRDEHLAAEVAALLLRRELILVVDARGARLDHRLHQLERVERPAEAGLRVGDDRREPVRPVPLLREVDLVGAQQRVVEALDERRDAVDRIEALVGIRRAGEVRVGRDLPAGEVDRLEAGAHHLHGLAAGQRAERANGLLALEQLPQPLGAEFRERVLGDDGTAEPDDLLGRVRPLDSAPPLVVPLRLELPDRLVDHLASPRVVVNLGSEIYHRRRMIYTARRARNDPRSGIRV